MAANNARPTWTPIDLGYISIPKWHRNPHRPPEEHAHLEYLANLLTTKRAPPIVAWSVSFDPPELYVVDGLRRVQAAKQAGHTSIRAIIRSDYANHRAAWHDAILRNTSPEHPTLTRAEAALRLIDYELDPSKVYRRYRNPYSNALAAAADLVRAATRTPDPALDPIAAALGQGLTAADLPAALERILQDAHSPYTSLRSVAANALPLVEANQRLRGLQRTGQLQPSHATAITRVLDPDLQNGLVDIALKRGLSARELRRYAQHANEHGNLDVPDRALASDRVLARDLSHQLEDYDKLPPAFRRRARRALRDLHAALQAGGQKPRA